MIRRLLIALTVSAGFAALLLSSLPSASAASPIRLFEAFASPSYALGAPNVTDGSVVKETVSGRDLNVLPQSNGDVKFQFDADHSLCVAAVDGNEAIVVRSCTGNGTLWIQIPASCSFCNKWKNSRESNLLGQAVYMYGAGNGTNLYWAIDGAAGYKVWQYQGP